MVVNILCDPPLGRPTIVSADKQSVTFTVVVETESVLKNNIEAGIWHNHDNVDEWSLLKLTQLETVGNQTSSIPHYIWFTATILGKPKLGSKVSFTVAFWTKGDESNRRWARDLSGIGDGTLIYQGVFPTGNDVFNFLQNVDNNATISPLETEKNSDCYVLHWQHLVKASSGKKPGFTKSIIGKSPGTLKWMAIVRLWTPWLAPRHGDGIFNPDKDAVVCSIMRDDGYHVVYLAVSGVENVLTTLSGDGEGNVIANGQNDEEKDGIMRVIIVLAPSFERGIAAAMYAARDLVRNFEVKTGERAEELKALTENKPNIQWLEEWYDGLTYCTWNGLGQDLTAEKIYTALDSLKTNDIHLTNLIIDDNWQSLAPIEGPTTLINGLEGAKSQFERGWVKFEAHKEGFPNGLKETVAKIRSDHPSIKHIAVWHAIFGYWGGVSPVGDIADNYKIIQVQKKEGVAGGKCFVVAEEDVHRLYNDFYSFLSSVGVDAVKTDAQFFLDLLEDADDRRSLINAYQDAWVINSLRHLSSKAISCMSQTPQILFHSQLPHNRPRLLVRNSDDFFPDQPASHPWHIFCNAYNALFTQYLNVLPDWDMFQTVHSYAAFHAAARCVSGGPIYITDVPGEHDVGLIKQMTAQTPRGNTIILRPHCVGKAIDAYVAYNDPALLKISNYVGFAHTGTGILGVFNVFSQTLTELVPLMDFPGTEIGAYVMRAHHTGKISKPYERNDTFAFVRLELPVQGWEILSAYPVHRFKRTGKTDITVANLGLVGKMTGAAAIVNTMMHIEETGRFRMWTSLKALGTFGLWIEGLNKKSLDEDFIALIFGKPVPPHCVQTTEESVLEIDLETAWKESDQKAGWSNEVSIEMFIN
ncbi:glycoside hydrolase family 36 protein [Patellaria atrata CBS 101060]|uniref:Glycoside hydrolase family 36 protein n=1 Tax=Patellaria atrata CBS 101060 TaxID=1346257 RepID=A0A9P4VT38_9PEZI|nr:glycoside hydrolase family 36 protein [Patellaria atrata CBS 101060]